MADDDESNRLNRPFLETSRNINGGIAINNNYEMNGLNHMNNEQQQASNGQQLLAIKGVNICKYYDNGKVCGGKRTKTLKNVNINVSKGKM